MPAENCGPDARLAAVQSFFDSARSTLKRPAPATNQTPPKIARFLRKLLYWAITWAAGYSQIAVGERGGDDEEEQTHQGGVAGGKT